MEKRAIRQQLLTQRKQLGEATCRELSHQVQQHLLDSDCFSHAETLALYSPINNEVRTDQLFGAARLFKKQVCYPRVFGKALQFVTVASAAELVPGTFGVAEPRDGSVLSADEIDLIVVPGVAFDRDGFRLGYGKGFYDRELSRMAAAAVSVGLCFDFQLCDSLPVEAHDEQLDYVVTETQFIPCRNVAAGSP